MIEYFKTNLGVLYLGDCLKIMHRIEINNVDMVLVDLPYGTTACKWDEQLDPLMMWSRLLPVVKDRAAMCFFGSEPFSSTLRKSNMSMFRYDWIWKKDKGGNFALVKYQPSKIHEIISVFSKKPHNYYPIMDPRPEKNKRKNKPRLNKSNVQGLEVYTENSRGNLDVKYPVSIREHNSVRNGFHPTQKPIDLCKYLVETYTRPGETVLDFTAGSGTTAVAAEQLGRRWICIEKEEKYCQIVKERIENGTR